MMYPEIRGARRLRPFFRIDTGIHLFPFGNILNPEYMNSWLLLTRGMVAESGNGMIKNFYVMARPIASHE
jgi:hypothetical protein